MWINLKIPTHLSQKFPADFLSTSDILLPSQFPHPALEFPFHPRTFLSDGQAKIGRWQAAKQGPADKKKPD